MTLTFVSVCVFIYSSMRLLQERDQFIERQRRLRLLGRAEGCTTAAPQYLFRAHCMQALQSPLGLTCKHT